jgi:glycosyltransferase 2 family protein
LNFQSSSKWKKVGRWLPGILISLVAAVILIFVTDWKEVGQAFRQINLKSLLFGMGLTVLFLIVRAAAWRELLDGKAGFWKSFRIVNEGYLLNNILIHRTGELARAIFMGQAGGMGFSRALSSIVLERVFDLVFAAGIFLLCLPLVVGASWAKTAGIVTLIIVLSLLVMLFLTARYRDRVERWLGKIQINGKLWNQLIKPQLNALLDGLAVLTRPRRFLFGAGLILLSWLIAFSFHFVLLRALIPNVPFWWAVFTDTSLAMGIALPSAPAALGVYEATIVGALVLLGIPASTGTGLAFAITLHAMQFVITAILGLIGLAQDGRSLAELGRLFEKKETEPSKEDLE